jgi:hypothetical protein
VLEKFAAVQMIELKKSGLNLTGGAF